GRPRRRAGARRLAARSAARLRPRHRRCARGRRGGARAGGAGRARAPGRTGARRVARPGGPRARRRRPRASRHPARRARGVKPWILERAARTPGAPALVVDGRSLPWFALAERARGLAAALAARGVGPGDRVAALLGNDPAFVELLHAAPLLGAVV